MLGDADAAATTAAQCDTLCVSSYFFSNEQKALNILDIIAATKRKKYIGFVCCIQNEIASRLTIKDFTDKSSFNATARQKEKEKKISTDEKIWNILSDLIHIAKSFAKYFSITQIFEPFVTLKRKLRESFFLKKNVFQRMLFVLFASSMNVQPIIIFICTSFTFYQNRTFI